MILLRDLASLKQLDGLRSSGPLVLVPTMGALHEGHLSLVRQGSQLGQVVVSIFVNPTQFGPGEDYQSYPRDLEADLALLKPLDVAAVFVPSPEQMYGPGDEVTIQPGSRSRDLCGAGRPGHFSGVLTVVAKLFGMVQPDIAIFGRKDAQQCLVIRQMVENLHLPVRLVDGMTVREPDGLAMSSRNRYLDPDQRQRALCLSRGLGAAEELVRQGERRSEVLVRAMYDQLKDVDSVEYAEVRTVPDLDHPRQVAGMTLLAVAARVGPARLIDNLVLDINEEGIQPGYLLGIGKE